MLLDTARIGFVGPSPIFTGDKNSNFEQRFRQDSQLAAYCFSSGTEIIRFIIDYRAIFLQFLPNLVAVS